MTHEAFISQIHTKILGFQEAQTISPPLSDLTELTYAAYTEDGVPKSTLHPPETNSSYVIVKPPIDQLPLFRETVAILEKRVGEGSLKRESAILFHLIARLMLHSSISGFSRIQIAQGPPHEVQELFDYTDWQSIIPTNTKVAYLFQLTIHPLLPPEIKVAIHGQLLKTDLKIARSKQCSMVLSIMKPHVVNHVQETGMTATPLPGPVLNWKKSRKLFESYPYYWIYGNQPQLYAITTNNGHA